jgi:hypothetical protein
MYASHTALSTVLCEKNWKLLMYPTIRSAAPFVWLKPQGPPTWNGVKFPKEACQRSGHAGLTEPQWTVASVISAIK